MRTAFVLVYPWHTNNASELACQSREPRLQEAIAEPIALGIGLRKQACAAIKRAITEMNIYGHPLEIRLDERQLSQDLGMSRTPIREALSVLEQEGFVRSVPRRGLIVVRISGYGQTGPYAARAGFGGIGEAMGGWRHIVGDPDRPPSRMGVSIGDALAATYGALGALAALAWREKKIGRAHV